MLPARGGRGGRGASATNEQVAPSRGGRGGRGAAPAPAPAPPAVKFYGACKVFNHTKGFGFIKVDDGREVFVHESAIPPNADGAKILTAGERVEFRVAKSVTDGRDKALHIRGPGGAPLQGSLPEQPDKIPESDDANWTYLFDEIFSP